MEKTETYYLHQTPNELAKDLIAVLPLTASDRLFEPFKGEGSFYNNFPVANPKDWTEIVEGRDYKSHEGEYDWVITNPPFRLQVNEDKRENSFWALLDYYTQRAKKGVAFLGNDRCFSVLTPKRMTLLSNRGWHITNIVVCSVKKWRGRYFFIVVEKKPSGVMGHLLKNY
jgi:hypothetical protein